MVACMANTSLRQLHLRHVDPSPALGLLRVLLRQPPDWNRLEPAFCPDASYGKQEKTPVL